MYTIIFFYILCVHTKKLFYGYINLEYIYTRKKKKQIIRAFDVYRAFFDDVRLLYVPVCMYVCIKQYIHLYNLKSISEKSTHHSVYNNLIATQTMRENHT